MSSVFATHAFATVLQQTLTAASSCVAPDPCNIGATSTGHVPICPEVQSLAIFVWGSLRTEWTSRVPCCITREFVEVTVAVDVPRCMADPETGQRDPVEMINDTSRIMEIITQVYGGLKAARFSGQLGGDCAMSTPADGFDLTDEAPCVERWTTTFDVEITDWQP
jgi:hypothetical protein